MVWEWDAQLPAGSRPSAGARRRAAKARNGVGMREGGGGKDRGRGEEVSGSMGGDKSGEGRGEGRKERSGGYRGGWRDGTANKGRPGKGLDRKAARGPGVPLRRSTDEGVGGLPRVAIRRLMAETSQSKSAPYRVFARVSRDSEAAEGVRGLTILSPTVSMVRVSSAAFTFSAPTCWVEQGRGRGRQAGVSAELREGGSGAGR